MAPPENIFIPIVCPNGMRVFVDALISRITDGNNNAAVRRNTADFDIDFLICFFKLSLSFRIYFAQRQKE